MDLISKLRQISHFCGEHDNNCTNCSYYHGGCAWMNAVWYMEGKTPDSWDTDRIVKIMEGKNEDDI